MFSRTDAMELLERAHAMNPGPWREHSKGVARAASVIAERLGLDAERAYVMGLMHDIGRYEGVRGLHHVIAGYDLMTEMGQPECARICITHSFPDGEISNYIGSHDVTEEEDARIRVLLASFEFDDNDRLIQLCDAISWNEGVCLMEKRLVNVVMRNGMIPGLKQKWQAWFDIKSDFEKRIGVGIYSLFPEAWDNTVNG